MMKELKVKHMKAIALISQGWTGNSIASELKITAQTLIEWKKDPLFMANLNCIKMDILESARSNLQNLSEVAANTLEDIMLNSKNDEVRRKAAMNILEANGYMPKANDTFGWGIGATDYENMRHELNGTAHMKKLLDGY